MQLRDRPLSPTRRWLASAAAALLMILVSAGAMADPPPDDAGHIDDLVIDDAVELSGSISAHVVIAVDTDGASPGVPAVPEPAGPEAASSECGVSGCPVARRRARSDRRGCPLRQARPSCDDRGCDLPRSKRYRSCGRTRWARRGCSRRSWRGCGSRSWRADRFALGVTKGRFALGETEARERGMLARVRVTRRLTAELEVGKTDYRDTAIRDRRVGGSVLLHPMPRARLSPYLSASTGRIQTEMDGVESGIEQRYREVGVGLSIRLGKRLRLEGDVRAGRRGLRDGDKSDISAAVSAPVVDDDRYRRARFNAIIYF